MALTYVTKAGEGVARLNQKMENLNSKLVAQMSQVQKQRNAKAEAIVKRGQAYSDNFYKLYGEQTRSGTEAWNAGAGELVGKLAMEQEELYGKAHGSNGTPELRNEWRLRQIRDKGIIANIGSWATLSNKNATAMQENQSAYNQDIDLGRMTRGNDIDKYNFAQNMQNDQYSNYMFNVDDAGNVLLDARNVDKDGNVIYGQSRNLSADVANDKAGNQWYSQIKEEDLLQNKLNKNWSDKNSGYSTLFQKETRTDKVYDPKTAKWTTVTKEVYDREVVKDDLLTKHATRLDAEIKGPGFEKTWDQLWRSGYLKNDDGEDLIGSEVSWSDLQKVQSMTDQEFIDVYGDIDNDPTTDAAADKKYLQKNVMQTGRQGLANYYSGNMVPAEDTITNTTTQDTKPSGSVEITPQKKREYEASSRVYNNFRKDAPNIINKVAPLPEDFTKEQHFERATAVADELNRNQTSASKSNGNQYLTGAMAKRLVEGSSTEEKFHGNPNAVYRVFNSQKAGGGKAYAYEMAVHENNLTTNDPLDLTIFMSGGMEIEDEAQNYLNKNYKEPKDSTPVKTYDTKEAAANARFKLGSGNVVAGTGKNKGKWIITKI
tara:strand:+ start:387 stop:2186 length:1800 start_codon:yes stop_codon:yes gene_type:complete